mmetsp:Transcript_19598/g.31338  ORF Transcript_19598/g.31338 Transcript_19598/m.31338 type:complete len:257 (+) Transcript_19598:104-874(+)
MVRRGVTRAAANWVQPSRKRARHQESWEIDDEEALQQTLVTNSDGRSGYSSAGGWEYLDSGTVRHVYSGTYSKGPRKGERCVSKGFKNQSVFEDSFFDLDIAAMRKAAELIAQFNRLQADKWIYVNECEVWQDGQGLRGLIEPMIEGEYLKFNSNSGYALEDTEFMQALSHFTYHISNGQYLVCDLQGGWYPDCYVLTDPVVLSSGKEFGPTDLGPVGMQQFFHHHVCGAFCDPSWMWPRKTANRFNISRGTTFMM